MFHKFESPSLWLVAQFRLEVQWHKLTMTEIIAEQTHAHHDLKGKEKGRAWVFISSFKHIFRSQHPLLLLPMVLSFWSVILCPSLQHMGLWGDAQHTCYYRKWSSQAHSDTVLFSPCVLRATWDLSKCSFHLCSSGTLWYLLFPASIHSATQTQQLSWWVLNTGLQSLLAGDPWAGYLTGCHLTFSWVMTAT